jgi:hypothetical protein
LEQTREQGAFRLNEGYYFAYRAEVSALKGADTELLENAERALSLLPTEEVMLKARLSARVADVAWRRGNIEVALSNYEEVLKADPSLLRRLGLALPVRITGVDAPFERQVIEYLADSPRFRADPNGLDLEVFPQNELTICLSSRGGVPLSCVQMGDFDETMMLAPAQQLVQEFHAKTFSLGYDIPQSQRMRLLGSSVILSSQNNTNAQQNRDSVLRP